MPENIDKNFIEEIKKDLWNSGPNVRNFEPFAKVHSTKLPKIRQLSDIERIVIHCTVADNWTTEQLIDYDLGPNHISSTGLPVASYSDIIFKGGNIDHVVDYTKETWHVGNWNYTSLGIALMFDPGPNDQKKPSDKMYSAMIHHVSLLAMGLNFTPDKVVGHRELKDTGWIIKDGKKQLRKTCPGLSIDLDIVRQDVAFYMQAMLKSWGFYDDKIDGLFGPKSKLALLNYKLKRDSIL
jgi:hypothetical protein